MKTFSQLRERRSLKKVKGTQVFDQKVKGVQLSIIKDKNKFSVHIDGDELDSYTSLAQAKRMGMEFAKEVGK
jgi:hypothetical protein